MDLFFVGVAIVGVVFAGAVVISEKLYDPRNWWEEVDE